MVVTGLWTLYTRGAPCGWKILERRHLTVIRVREPRLVFWPNFRRPERQKREAGDLEPHSSGHGHEARRPSPAPVPGLAAEEAPSVGEAEVLGVDREDRPRARGRASSGALENEATASIVVPPA